jgi:hypothetical protein
MASRVTNPITMETLIASAATWDASFTEIPLDVRDLHFDPEGIRCGGDTIRTDEAGRSRLFEKLGAPARYLTKLSPKFQASALNEHAERGDFGKAPKLVLDQDRFLTIVPGELFSLPNAAVLRAIEQALEDECDSLIVTRVRQDIDRLDIDLVSPSKEEIVRTGDVVQSGLHIVHERFGTQATLVEAFVYRLICRNGMTRRECVNDGAPPLRTRKLPVDFPNNRELQMSQIRRLAQRNWSLLETQLSAFRATSERSANVEELLTRWLQRARISTNNMLPRLLAAWHEEGAEQTQYGAINALTRVATHDQALSERQRRTLAALAGLLAFSEVHICKLCFSVLARHTAVTEDRQ